MAIPINELFWLEQEDLDSPDNMFMPADTPPNCLNAYKHRRRICKEEYDRVLTRAIIKQSKEMASLVTKYARSVDTALLPERQPPSSHHQFITGQQYVRQNTALFSKAMAHVMTNSDKVEDGTPKFDDMDVVKDNEALMYKTECQDTIDIAVNRLRLKQQGQRNSLLLHSTYALVQVAEDQDRVLGKTNTSPIHSINAKRDPRNRSGYNYSKSYAAVSSPSTSPERSMNLPTVSTQTTTPALISPLAKRQ